MPDKPVEQVDRSVAKPGWLGRTIGWLSRREWLILVAAAAFQVLFLLAMTALHATPLLTGETVLVRVMPVDPRDLFRGDYVMLSYDFSQIEPHMVEGLAVSFHRGNTADWLGRTVYVSLVPEPDGKHWRAGKASVHRPASGKFLRGTMIGPGRLEFGIEAYYVQEGRGREYEKAIRNRRLSAEIAVAADGQAALRGLRIE